MGQLFQSKYGNGCVFTSFKGNPKRTPTSLRVIPFLGRSWQSRYIETCSFQHHFARPYVSSETLCYECLRVLIYSFLSLRTLNLLRRPFWRQRKGLAFSWPVHSRSGFKHHQQAKSPSEKPETLETDMARSSLEPLFPIPKTLDIAFDP